MKRLTLLLVGGVALSLTLASCDTAGDADFAPYEGDAYAHLEFDSDASDGQVDLIAGQHMDVGRVEFSKTGDQLTVTYVIEEPGLCLSETHLAVASSLSGIPRNKSGNPVPGQFPYSTDHSPCVTSFSYTVDVDAWDPIYIAAHAVVINNPDADCGYIFGIGKDGVIYKIYLGDVNVAGDETAVALFDTGLDGTAANNNWPNSLAYDRENGRLYYSNTTALGPIPPPDQVDPNSDLYFLDLATNTQVFAGNLSRRSADALFFDGAYWYVSQNITDNLRKITFNPDGTIDERLVACEDFVGDGVVTPLFFGDIAYDSSSGLIYGSMRKGSDDVANGVFFSLDPATCAYTEIATGAATTLLLQLAYDCDGNLIGQSAADLNYYLIDEATGGMTLIASALTPSPLNDLSDGDCQACEAFDETAWGWGANRFVESGNWARYITLDPDDLD